MLFITDNCRLHAGEVVTCDKIIVTFFRETMPNS